MRFRLYPSTAQKVLLLEPCGHARYVWNLGLEQRPKWRKAGVDEGLRIVGPAALRVRQDNRARSSVLVPKVGWVSFKRSRALVDWKSYRIKRDRAGRWHTAFAVIPDPIPAPDTGDVVGVDRGVTVAVALSTGEMTSPAGLSPKEAERLLRLQRRLARARRGSNRRHKVRNLIGQLKARESRKSQATFVGVVCGHRANADVNAARNIAAGYAVTARGDRRGLARSVKREPQHARPSKVA